MEKNNSKRPTSIIAQAQACKKTSKAEFDEKKAVKKEAHSKKNVKYSIWNSGNNWGWFEKER